MIIKKKLLLKNKNFLFLLTSRSLETFNDSIYAIAFPWMVYELTGSKLLMTTLFAINFIPLIITSIISITFIDNICKERLISYLNLMITILFFIMGILFKYKLLTVEIIFIFSFITQSIASVVKPTKISILPFIVTKEELLEANSFDQLIVNIFDFLGYLCGGIIVTFIGLFNSFIIMASISFLEAISVKMINYENNFSKKNNKEIKKKTASILYLFEGLKFIYKHKLIFIFICLGILVNFSLAPFFALETVYVKDLLCFGPEGITIIEMSSAFGVILGSILIKKISKKIKGPQLAFLGILGLGISYSGYSFLTFLNIGKLPLSLFLIIISVFLDFLVLL